MGKPKHWSGRTLCIASKLKNFQTGSRIEKNLFIDILIDLI